jgi:hypothetical protein
MIGGVPQVRCSTGSSSLVPSMSRSGRACCIHRGSHQGQKDAFNAAMAKAQASASPEAARTFAFRSKPYGQADPFDLFTEVRKYQVHGIAGQITTPILILDPDNEQFFPGQPRQLYDLLPGEKEIIELTQAQGRTSTASPPAAQLTHTQMLDWLADHLPPLAGKVSEFTLSQ